MGKPRIARKLPLSYRIWFNEGDWNLIEEIRKLAGFPVPTSLIIRFALRFFAELRRAEQAYEEEYLRKVAKRIVLERHHEPYQVQPYIDELVEKASKAVAKDELKRMPKPPPGKEGSV